MKWYIFNIEFDTVRDNAQVVADLQCHFQNVNIVCTDCFKVLQYMNEAFRGALIGAKERIIFGRLPIIEIENLRKQQREPVLEIILTFDSIPMNVRLLEDHVRIDAISDSSEWAENLHNFLATIFPNTKVDVIVGEAKGEVLGKFADMERRLNEGELLGEVRGVGTVEQRSIGDFVKHFPQYSHFIK
jgi:hypothetical protein